VLTVAGLGATIAAARDTAYAAVAEIAWAGRRHRRDIAAAAAGGGLSEPGRSG
jgi:phosphoribosylamine--glycine ligase